MQLTGRFTWLVCWLWLSWWIFVFVACEESVASAFLLVPFTHLRRPCASSWSTPIQIKHRPFRPTSWRATNVSLADAAVGTAKTDSSAPPVRQSEKQYYDADQDELLVADATSLPRGSKEGFAVVHHFTYQPTIEEWQALLHDLPPKDVTRLHLSSDNVTLPIALMMMDPNKYPTISRARKFCRHGRILLHKGPLGLDLHQQQTIFLPDNVTMGHVGDRVLVGDVIGRQVAVGKGYFAAQQQKKAPPFALPIVYQDDHIALVHKPAGVVVYSPKNAGQGILTVKAALPHVLQPPTAGTLSALKRPKSVHRLDKATSGILLIAKTLPAMNHLSRQFEDRAIQKTYTAVVNGNPNVNGSTAVTSQQAYHDFHVDVDPKSNDMWQVIDTTLDGKQAVTLWRILRQVRSLRARDNLLTLVEVKPKTGRYHQIRRHMAWVCERALVGDKEYDGNHQSAIKLRGRGLFLCSNRVTLEHPFYNTRAGRGVWDSLQESDKSFELGKLWVRQHDDTVMATASIPLSQKFESFLDRSEAAYVKYAVDTTAQER